jgi:ubiquinone/menaquinone biosynthesis C-methylase UbiE
MRNLPEQFKEIVSRDTRVKYFSGNPVKDWLLERFFKRIFSLIREIDPQGKSMLEVGCGDGIAAYLIRKEFPGLDYFGVDIKKEELTTAAKILDHPCLAVMDGKKLAARKRNFDLVIALEVLEHVEKWEEVLEEICRAAQKKAIISVPAYPYYQFSNLAFGKNLSRLGEHPDHVNQFTNGGMKKRLVDHFKTSGSRAEINSYFSFPWAIYEVIFEV